MKTLERLREICDAATEGPWELESGMVFSVHISGQHKNYLGLTDGLSCKENAKFIATARSAMPVLLDALEKAMMSMDCDCGSEWDHEDFCCVGCVAKIEIEEMLEKLND